VQLIAKSMSWLTRSWCKYYRMFHRFRQAKFLDGGSVFGSSQFSILNPAASKKAARFKSGQIWPKNNHLALLIRDTLCSLIEMTRLPKWHSCPCWCCCWWECCCWLYWWQSDWDRVFREIVTHSFIIRSWNPWLTY